MRNNFYAITALLILSMLLGMIVIAASTTNLFLFTAKSATWSVICYLVAKKFLN